MEETETSLAEEGEGIVLRGKEGEEFGPREEEGEEIIPRGEEENNSGFPYSGIEYGRGA